MVEYTRASADRADAGSARLVLKMDDEEGNHNGGLLLFGPDKHLYIGTGDGGGAGDEHGARGNAQNLGSLLGKLLRIDPAESGGRPYGVPSDNPFVGRDGARGEIYSYGLRNPWRYSFDRRTGDLSIGDVGQNEIEEIDFVRRGKGRGANFGWRAFEGRDALHAGRERARARAARHLAQPRRRLVLDHRRRRRPRPAAAGAPRPLRVRRLLQGPDPVRAALSRARAIGAQHAAEGRQPLLVRGGRARPRLRRLAERPGLPARRAMSDLARLDIALVRADNPGPYTLSGTNTWVVGRDPAWVIDPGPDLAEHLDAVAAEVEARGGAGGIAVTHDHLDHVEGVLALRDRLGRPPVAAARFAADVRLAEGTRFGPLVAHAVPGHAPDHFAFVRDGACFTGDAVLGEGSVFVEADLAGYLEGLERLRELPLEVICPGHGPPVWEPRAKLEQYLAHRRERERRLLAALDDGLREEDELIDVVWDDAPAALRQAVAVTLGAHREKLQAEGRWPRPDGGTPAP